MLEQTDRTIAEQRGLKLGQVAQPKRVALTGMTTSPPVYEVMEILGREETLARLRAAQAMMDCQGYCYAGLIEARHDRPYLRIRLCRLLGKPA